MREKKRREGDGGEKEVEWSSPSTMNAGVGGRVPGKSQSSFVRASTYLAKGLIMTYILRLFLDF